jgi:hypothetical protein
MPKPANQPGKQPAKPDILPPETTPTPAPGIAPALASKPTLRQRAERLCSDENLDFFAHLLDDWFRLPFTPIRVGLDGLIGLIPGLGDILAGIASFVLVFAAWIRGVPYVTLLRMMVNIAIEVLIGSIPLFGDIFDIAWKANRRNYNLMTRHLARLRLPRNPLRRSPRHPRHPRHRAGAHLPLDRPPPLTSQVAAQGAAKRHDGRSPGLHSLRKNRHF